MLKIWRRAHQVPPFLEIRLGTGSLFSGDTGAWVRCARNIWLARDFASACVGDDDVVHVERAAYGLIEVYGSFNQIDLGAQLVPLRCGQVARPQHHLIAGGRTELIFFLLGVEGLLRQDAGFFGGRHLRAVLLQSDLSVAHIDENRVLKLAVLHHLLALIDLRARAIGLRRAIPNRKHKIQPAL